MIKSLLIKSTALFIALGFSSMLFSQNTVINTTIAIFPGSEIVEFGQNLYIGPDANVILNGTWRIGSENVYIHPDAIIAGTGTLVLENPANLMVGGSALAWTTTSIDGGNANLDVNIEINNPNNISLVQISPLAGLSWLDPGTKNNLYIGKDLNYTVNDAHVMLNDYNLMFDANATETNAGAQRYAVTNGLGFVNKEAIANGAAWIFQIGRAENDYTPGTITNNDPVDAYWMRVKNYIESTSDETAPDNGVFRSWNTYSGNGGAANLALQHNSSTNGVDYNDAGGFVTYWTGVSNTDWQRGTGAIGSDNAGTVVGSRIHNRDYPASAVASNYNTLGWNSKSSNEFHPLPVSLVAFDAEKIAFLQSNISWKTSAELNNDYYEVERQIDGSTAWESIAKVQSKNSKSTTALNYNFFDKNAALGNNFYRLKIVSTNKEVGYSNIRKINFAEPIAQQNVDVFPNPTDNTVNVNVSNDGIIKAIQLFTIDGKIVEQVYNATINGSSASLNLEQLAAANYILVVQIENGSSKFIKITKGANN